MASTWAEAFVEPSLDWQFLREEDLTSLAELRLAIEYFDDPVVQRSLDEMRKDYASPHSHAEQHCVVGRDKAGTIVAYSWNHPSPPDQPNLTVWLEIGVHPAWRHRKIGQRLVTWSIARARMWAEHIKEKQLEKGERYESLKVTIAVDEGSRIQEDILQDRTLKPSRWFFDMHREIREGDEAQSHPAPDGYTVEPYSEELSEEIRQAHNLAFSTRRGAKPVGKEGWQNLVNRPECRKDWSWVVIEKESGRIVGYVLNSQLIDENREIREGWTDMLGVVPDARGKGLGAVLIGKSIQSFAENGANFAGIGVDTESEGGSARLFVEFGYVSADRVVLYDAVFTD